MSADRDVTRIVRSWLHEDAHEDADRVLNLVLDEIDTTPQRSASWLARRFPIMNSNMFRVGIAAAALTLAVIVLVRFLPGSNVGVPSATPIPTPTPRPVVKGPLEAGTYVAHPFPAPDDSLGFTFNVPDGWRGEGPPGGRTFAVVPAEGTEGPDGAAIAFIQVTDLYSDPCHGNQAGSPTVPIGETAADLAGALEEQRAYAASPPTDVTLGGYEGKRMDLLLPSDVDFAACDTGGFWVWDAAPYAQGPGNRWHLWILDVQEVRIVILAEDFTTTSAQTQAQLLAIVDSIRIEPAT